MQQIDGTPIGEIFIPRKDRREGNIVRKADLNLTYSKIQSHRQYFAEKSVRAIVCHFMQQFGISHVSFSIQRRKYMQFFPAEGLPDVSLHSFIRLLHHLLGPYSFSHRPHTPGMLPLQKEIYPQKSETTPLLYQIELFF